MKKIGVCACYQNHNYGSMLQSLATQTVLEDFGYDCEMIRYKKKKSLFFIVKQIPRFFNRITINDKAQILSKKINFAFHPQAKKEGAVRDLAFERFKNDYFKKLSPVFYGYRQLKSGSLRYDLLLSGSDQVWSPSALATHFYDLSFGDDKCLKASYASSFGVKTIPWYQLKRTRKYLNDIKFISVRETSGQSIVKKLTNKDVPLVCDPTMLLSKERWLSILKKKSQIDDEYVFAYFLGTDPISRREVTKFARSHNLKIVSIHHMDQYVKADEDFGDIVLSDVGPDDWVYLLSNSKYVCTDSFHGCIFSIIFNKEFVAFNRYNDKAKVSKNSRIESLCNKLGLQSRRFLGDLSTQFSKKIDYERINSNVEEFRKESTDYLASVFNYLENKK